MIRVAWRSGLPLQALPAVLLSRRARRAVHGMVMLRRAYEHVLVMAVVEGAAAERDAYYDGYVEALRILSARASLIARAL